MNQDYNGAHASIFLKQKSQCDLAAVCKQQTAELFHWSLQDSTVRHTADLENLTQNFSKNKIF